MSAKAVTCLVIVALVLALSIPAWAGVVNVTASPDRIDVGLNFSGQKVSISGIAPPDSDIYVKLVSPTINVKLNKKGKFGFLWMNVSHAIVHNIPGMYLVYSSAPLEQLSPALQRRMGIDSDFQAVRDKAIIKETAGNHTRTLTGLQGKDYLDALFNMYEKSGLYRVKENAIQREGRQFHLTVTLPGSATQGKTAIIAYAVKNGQIVGTSRSTLDICPVGMVRWERTTAQTKGLLYGTYAVLIALAAGLIINFLFHFLEKRFAVLMSRLSGKLPAERREVSTEIH
ncbi:TIGR02186 family protein [Desulfofundulus thermosubterraneus]|uniref:Putative transmembrane protein (Alph_Pro_TM) n=1 Tax=Desulfofundulus thermosubterraneus DSM 16057 TaxID=1121432 RepID=A0A1M6CAC4_9FIRM|nr:TIGR02186 family protein [Desulfofundulus thermosubterraneus]SHI57985.1 Putative transmembrane protein (Alph_Pro_TM) [Desulfofundulus thermosubterraneus DSM 16057]